MTGTDLIDDCTFVRRVIGYAALAVVIQPALRDRAMAMYRDLLARGAVEGWRTPAVSAVLLELGAGLLPAAHDCRRAMEEMDRYLRPMRRLRRMLAASPDLFREDSGDEARENFDDQQ